MTNGMKEGTYFQEASSFEEAQKILGEMINLEQPASESVTRRALVDQHYAFYLICTKDIPGLQKKLLQDPRNKAFETNDFCEHEKRREPEEAKTKLDNIQLVHKAAKSFAEWGKAGFKVAQQSIIQKRLAACRKCEYFTDPPKSIIYQGIKVITGKDDKICSECGCLVSKKVMLPSEQCPKQDPLQPCLSRWGEAWELKRTI
jgi:hypothetical protein